MRHNLTNASKRMHVMGDWTHLLTRRFAITLLDIPTEDDGSSAYKGPYDGTGQELFDEAVTCSDDNKTITFNLAIPAGDFNYTTTLLSFSPVREDADTGEKYDQAPLSNGPYKIEENVQGTKLVLARNENWDPASDPIRGEKAFPDQIQLLFGLDQSVITQRIIANFMNLFGRDLPRDEMLTDVE